MARGLGHLSQGCGTQASTGKGAHHWEAWGPEGMSSTEGVRHPHSQLMFPCKPLRLKPCISACSPCLADLHAWSPGAPLGKQELWMLGREGPDRYRPRHTRDIEHMQP